MIFNNIARCISTNNVLWQATNKSLLAKLRKKTGYTFANCKKALEIHQNDVEKVCLTFEQLLHHCVLNFICTLR